MRNLVKIIFWVTILINLVCAEITLDQITKQLQVQRAEIKNYKADIVNTVEGAFIPSRKIQVGKIYFQGPGLIRSDIFEPRQSTLTKDQKSFVIDSQGNINEIEKEKAAFENQFKDPLELFKKFEFVVSEVDQNTIKLIGVPKSNKTDEPFSQKIFSKVVFYLDRSNFTAKEIRVHNAGGAEIIKISTEYKSINQILFPYKTTTLLTFSGKSICITTIYNNIVLNGELSPEIFELKKIKEEMLLAKGN